MPSPTYAAVTAAAISPLGPIVLLIGATIVTAVASTWTLIGGAVVAVTAMLLGQYYRFPPLKIAVAAMAAIFGGWVGTPAYLHLAQWAGWIPGETEVSNEVMAVLAVPASMMTVAVTILLVMTLYLLLKTLWNILSAAFPALNNLAVFAISRGSAFGVKYVKDHIPGDDNAPKTSDTLKTRFWD